MDHADDFASPQALPGRDGVSWLSGAVRSSHRECAPDATAVVHDWCPDFRGGERVLAAICRLTEARHVFTLFDFLPPEIRATHFEGVEFHPSFVNSLPAIRRYYRSLFFLCPFLIEQFDLTSYDLVVSSSAAFARGVILRPDQAHVCYVHSPIRYAWDEQFSYLHQAGLGFGPKGLLYRLMLHHLRIWDARTAHGPDVMLANSRYVRSRIRHIYGRDARVLAPPVPLDELEFVAQKDDYYVTASYLAPYKRTDLVVQAFRAMPHRRLVVIGGGQQSDVLRRFAAPNIEFTGHLPRRDLIQRISRARALVYAGCEDFGITLAEAQGCGTPVIAFGRGGAEDIVRSLGSSAQPTGLLFAKQTDTAVREAVDHFEDHRARFAPLACRDNASRFSVARFEDGMRSAVAFALDRKRHQTSEAAE